MKIKEKSVKPMVYTGYMLKVKCAYCGKDYVKIEPTMWRYKFQKGLKKYSFCSYGCMQSMRRKFANKDSDRIMKATVSNKGVAKQMRLDMSIDAGEEHKLKDWAEMYDVDFYQLWSMCMEMRMSVDESIFILSQRKAN